MFLGISSQAAMHLHTKSCISQMQSPLVNDMLATIDGYKYYRNYGILMTSDAEIIHKP